MTSQSWYLVHLGTETLVKPGLPCSAWWSWEPWGGRRWLLAACSSSPASSRPGELPGGFKWDDKYMQIYTRTGMGSCQLPLDLYFWNKLLGVRNFKTLKILMRNWFEVEFGATQLDRANWMLMFICKWFHQLNLQLPIFLVLSHTSSIFRALRPLEEMPCAAQDAFPPLSLVMFRLLLGCAGLALAQVGAQVGEPPNSGNLWHWVPSGND